MRTGGARLLLAELSRACQPETIHPCEKECAQIRTTAGRASGVLSLLEAGLAPAPGATYVRGWSDLRESLSTLSRAGGREARDRAAAGDRYDVWAAAGDQVAASFLVDLRHP